MSLRQFSEQEATLFFKQDYYDQEMAKWQGFRLIDHIESVDDYLTEEADKRDLRYQSDMSDEEISEVLATAWAEKHQVTIQLTIKNEEGLLNTSLTGLVVGFTPENDLILDTHMPIAITDIHSCVMV